jgi:hypothetical protein
VNGVPWRILVLDRDPADPVWLLATVEVPADVLPAHLAAADAVSPVGHIRPGHLLDVDEETAGWVTTASGLVRPAFTALRHPAVWRVEEGGQP